MGKILNIVIVILILAALVYGYMQFTKSPDADTPEGLSTTSDSESLDAGLSTQTQQNDFVALLLDLKQISLDTEFLTSSVFTSLTDFSRDITPQNVGRRNPFAPIGANAGVDERSTQVSAFTTPSPAPTARRQNTPAPAAASAPASTPPASTPASTPTVPVDQTPPADQTPPPSPDQLAPDETPPPDESFLDGGL